LHDRLAAQYDVLVPAHPGFEGSDGFEEMDRMEDLVFHYDELLEALGIDRPILMGASFGGWVAAEFAVRYAERLRALVLVDALGLRVSGAPAADLLALDPAQTRSTLFAEPSAPLAQRLVPDAPAAEALLATLKARRVFARFAWQFPDNPRLGRYLYRITCPTLILWGEHDRVVPLQHGQAYRQAIAAAELVVVPACGHLPHLERPEAVSERVLSFLRRLDRSAPCRS
jgi:pimeloyl-ACP methyl ester carboxylesterase